MIHRNVYILQNYTTLQPKDRSVDSLLVSDAVISHVCKMQYKVAEILIFMKIPLNKKVLLTNQGS